MFFKYCIFLRNLKIYKIKFENKNKTKKLFTHINIEINIYLLILKYFSFQNTKKMMQP